ncbi:ACP S-malonyltransferase [Brevibacillus agri]|uniref:ACP S-malonyltransferase n=1 Tax=Brevibacillus agri TaxID=51101 RepID=UPI0024C0C9C2|nr:ACP S-malonyltransferase [Brevibacillus agri]WHX28323.1 ACP S-malonyltransferase [Brevibacillus agri]
MIKIALLFPGQGSQYNLMGKALLESSPEARDIFQRTNEILGYDLLAIINGGNLEQLTRTEHAQPAIFAYSYAIFQSIWKEKKFFPSFMAGHSLGEFTALTCADVFRYEDALRLVMERATIMQQATADGFGGMAAINGLHPLLVEEECARVSNGEDQIVVANYNSSNQVVISGAKSLIKVAMENLAKIGAITIPLQVSAPFHTPYLELSNQMFQRAIAQTPMSALKWPVISNVDAKPYSHPAEIQERLSVQMISAVRWKETIEYMLRQGVNTFIELGPKSALTNLLKRDFSHVRAYSYEENYEEITAAIDEQIAEKRPSVISRSLAIAVCTRNQNWNEEEYQKGVIEPYRKIQALGNKLEEEGREESIEEIRQAIEMLRSVFVTKKVPLEEQRERFTQIFDETKKRHLFDEFVPVMFAEKEAVNEK